MKTRVLMCGSDLTVKGGMKSVVQNYLKYHEWGDYDITYVPTHITTNAVNKLIFYLKAYLTVSRMVKSNDMDVAHIHVSERGSFWRKSLLIRLLKKHDIPIILHYHGGEFPYFYNHLSKSWKKRVQKIIKMVDCNIVLSDEFAGRLRKIVPSALIKTLDNAVPISEKQHYDPDQKGILMLGTLTQLKGIYDLLDAIKKLDDQLDPEIKFYIGGAGEADKILSECEKRNILHRIGYLGWINEEKKEEIYPQIILHVLPSYVECFPMAILETYANRIPNISTNISAIPKIVIPGETGELIEPGDVNALVEKILYLVNNREVRMKYSENGFRKIKNEYGLEVHINKIKDIYETFSKKSE